MDGCTECREFVAALARFDTDAELGQRPSHSVDAVIPDHIGRYAVRRRLGAGEMGVVHEGYDDSLERRVALKFLREQLSSSQLARAKVFAEAKAMARVSHHNVAQVYEAAAVDDQLFIVMEFIEGPTLSQWLERRPKAGSPWAIIDVFVAAGRGLHAAHAAGVVHRDFKPDNVQMTLAHVPKVVDFGLAGMMASTPTPSLGERPSLATMPGAGTPLFMAPEVLEGQPADARSDQFSFCVALFCALYGQPPFGGTSLPELESNVLAQRLASLPARTTRPERVHRAVLRGLNIEPDARWPSMEALVNELDRCKQTWRRRRVWLAAGALAVLGGGTGAALAQSNTDTCTDASDDLIGVWDVESRAAVTENLRRPDLAYSSRVADLTITWLDDYAERWIDARTELCEASEPGSSSSLPEIERRFGCLGDARRALGAVSSFLATTMPEQPHGVVGVFSTLPNLGRCSDVEVLMADVAPPPADERAGVDEVRQTLAVARAARAAEAPRQTADAIAGAQRLSQRLDYPPLETEVQIEHGLALFEAGDDEGAARELTAALGSSMRLGQTHQSGRAARGLAQVLGSGLQRLTEARVYAQLARDMAEREHDPAVVVQSELRLAQVDKADGKLDDALKHVDAALEFLRSGPDPDPLLAADLHGTRAELLGTLGDLERADASCRHALGIELEILGPDHPRVATTRNGLAAILGVRGRFEESLAELEQARRIVVASHPPEHFVAIAVQQNIAAAHLGMERFPQAEREFRSLLSLAKFSGVHPAAARLRRNLAMALLGQDRNHEARVEARAALDGITASLGENHPDVAVTKEILAAALGSLGARVQATALLDEVLVARAKHFEADHPALVRAHVERIFLQPDPAPQAQTQLREAITTLEAELGPTHAAPLRAREVLAAVLAIRGDRDGQEVELRAALSLTPEGSRAEAVVRMALAHNQLVMGRIEAAAELLPPSRVESMRTEHRARATFVRGQIEWERGIDRQAALTLARQSLTAYTSDPLNLSDEAQRVRQWLDEHEALAK